MLTQSPARLRLPVLIVQQLTSYLSFLALLHFLHLSNTSIYYSLYRPTISLLSNLLTLLYLPFQCQLMESRVRPGAPAQGPTTSRRGPPSWTPTTSGRHSLLPHWRSYQEPTCHQLEQFLKVHIIFSYRSNGYH